MESYVVKLFDESDTIDLSKFSNPIDDRNCRFVWKIGMTKVKDALSRNTQNSKIQNEEICLKISSTLQIKNERKLFKIVLKEKW